MAPSADPAEPPPKSRSGRDRSAPRRLLLIGGPALAVVAALAFYLAGGRYASTDDAYVQAARVDVSTNIPGRVSEVDVHDNQAVRAGQVLFRLDPRRFEIAVADAEAQLAVARRKIPALQADYRQRQADEESMRTTLAYRKREFDRQTQLAADGISSHAQLDQAANDLASARQQLAAASQQSASALADLGGNLVQPIDEQPGVRQAQAALDRAKLELSYTVVTAPIDGVAAKVEQLQVGDYVNAASPLFALVSQRRMWIEANFKETDVTHMRPGQHATYRIDAYPAKTFDATVESASPGTGSSFALLPPENASGNWVKVVQRLPVRLSVGRRSAAAPLAAGMSVRVKVDTQHHRALPFLGG
ncbi:HlyD family secretion protein [Phenylobacterium sp.]|uniref:HlyD family secretion protein n=1 Tax=Phenylobacterium sp. TaxID=1871053 RepID=UPI002F3FFCF7